jgi:hypothetical protein
VARERRLDQTCGGRRPLVESRGKYAGGGVLGLAVSLAAALSASARGYGSNWVEAQLSEYRPSSSACIARSLRFRLVLRNGR